MEINRNILIVLAAIIITAAVFFLTRIGNASLDGYLGVAAIVGGGLALYIGFRFMNAYIGRTKKANELPPYAELQTYNEPYARGEFTLFFELPEEDEVKLSLKNIDGQEVKVLKEGKLASGSYPVKVDGRELANGTYYYELQTSNQRTSKKLIVQN